MQEQRSCDISIAEQKRAAMDKIVRTVNICETSTSRMRSKLKAKGFSSQVIDEALAEAQRCSLIDDMRYANCLVRSAVSSRKGLARVEEELRLLDIDIDDVESYRELSESDEANQLDMALEVLRLHPTRAKNRYLSSYRKLIGKGYSCDVAAEAARIWCAEASCMEDADHEDQDISAIA